MGAPGSSTRASHTFLRAIRTWKDVNYMKISPKSLITVSLESADESCNSSFVSHIPQLRSRFPIPIPIREGFLPVKSGSNFQLLNKYPGHSDSSLGGRTSIWERQFARSISSHFSPGMVDEEHVEAELGGMDADLGDTDVELLKGENDGPTMGISPTRGSAINAKVRALWELMSGHDKTGKTVPNIEMYISKGKEFTKDDAISMIFKLKRLRRYKQALEISDWLMNSKTFPWTVDDHVIRLVLKGSLGLSSEVEDIFNNSPPEFKTQQAYNAVIKHFCENGSTTQSLLWLDKLTASGLLTQPFAFNRVLLLFRNRNMEQKIPGLLASMEAANVSKDIFTYNILMSVKKKENDVLGVQQIFEECKADPNVKLDGTTYATLSSCYIDLGWTEKAIACLEDIQKLGLATDTTVEKVMLTLWGKLGNKEKVLDAWNTMSSRKFVSTPVCLLFMETFGKLGMLDEVEKVFNNVKLRGGPLRSKHYEVLLSTYIRNDMMDKVESLLLEISQTHVQQGMVLTHHLVEAYLKLDKVDEALKVVSDKKWQSRRPMLFKTLFTLLNAAAEEGNIPAAEKCFKVIAFCYNQKSLSIYNTLLKAYANCKSPPADFLDRMAKDGTAPDEETHRLLQECLETITVLPGESAPSNEVSQSS